MKIYTTKNQGLILITTLLFLTILTTLTLSQLQLLMLYVKTLNQINAQNSSINKLEKVALTLIATINPKINDACLIPTQSIPDNFNKLLQNSIQNCQIIKNKIKYQYVIENLGIFKCLLSCQNNSCYKTQHWLITIATPTSTLSSGLIKYLQIRMVTMAEAQNFINKCKNIRYVNTGSLTWQYF